LLFDQKVKDAFDKISLQVRDPQFAKGVVRVEAKALHNYTGEGRAGNFRLVSDESPESGGEGKGATPLHHFLAGLAFCEQVTFVRHCAAHSVQIDSLETSVKGYFDRRGVYGVADVDPGFQEIVVEMRIRSPEKPDAVREALAHVEKHCPAYNTLKKGAHVIHKATLNDKHLEISQPQISLRAGRVGEV